MLVTSVTQYSLHNIALQCQEKWPLQLAMETATRLDPSKMPGVVELHHLLKEVKDVNCISFNC